MLTLTPAASDAVRMLVEAMPVDSETGGLRISGVDQTADGMTYDMAIVDGPQGHDDEIEAQGAYVFVAPLASEFLDSRTLHAQLERGHVRFMVLDEDPPQD